MTNASRFGPCAAALLAVACSPTPPPEPPDTRAADTAAIRTAVVDWSAAARAKDADRFASFYADDAVLMLEAAPDSRGKSAIRETIGALMSDPSFALSFQNADVVVARSGDLAYDTGTYELTLSGPNAQPAAQRGTYVVVWRKQVDGAWKVAIDAPNSDPSAAAQ
jgi:uncharacterized protein (TIGR02246 family)